MSWSIQHKSRTGGIQYILASHENKTLGAETSNTCDFNSTGYTRGTVTYKISGIVGTTTVKLQGSNDGSIYFNIGNGNTHTSNTDDDVAENLSWSIPIRLLRIGINSTTSVTISNISLNCNAGGGGGGEIDTTNLDVENLDVTNLSASGINMTGDIIPEEDNAYNLGSSEKKWKDVFISEDSIWIGDKHKLSIDNGEFSIKKRNTAGPSLVLNHSQYTFESLVNNFDNLNTNSTLNDVKLHHWLNYARTLPDESGINFSNLSIRDLFSNTENNNFENEIDTSLSLNIIENEVLPPNIATQSFIHNSIGTGYLTGTTTISVVPPTVNPTTFATVGTLLYNSNREFIGVISDSTNNPNTITFDSGTLIDLNNGEHIYTSNNINLGSNNKKFNDGHFSGNLNVDGDLRIKGALDKVTEKVTELVVKDTTIKVGNSTDSLNVTPSDNEFSIWFGNINEEVIITQGVNSDGRVRVDVDDNGAITSYSVSTVGSEYNTIDPITITQDGSNNNATGTITSVDVSGGITGITITGGTGYIGERPLAEITFNKTTKEVGFKVDKQTVGIFGGS